MFANVPQASVTLHPMNGLLCLLALSQWTTCFCLAKSGKDLGVPGEGKDLEGHREKVCGTDKEVNLGA